MSAGIDREQPAFDPRCVGGEEEVAGGGSEACRRDHRVLGASGAWVRGDLGYGSTRADREHGATVVIVRPAGRGEQRESEPSRRVEGEGAVRCSPLGQSRDQGDAAGRGHAIDVVPGGVAVEAGRKAMSCRRRDATNFLAFTRKRDEGSKRSTGESAPLDLAGRLGDVEDVPAYDS